MAENSSDFSVKVKVDPNEAVKGLDLVHESLSGIESLVAKIGLAVGLVELGHKAFELSETYEQVQNRLRLVTKDEEDLRDVTHELFLVSEETRASVSGTVEIYTRLSRAAQGLNIPQHDLLEVTRALNEAAIISGKSTESLSGVVGQLALGLQTGTLNGRALKLILRDFPDIAEALAKQLGVSSNEFKKLGEEGKISAQDLLQALVASREELEGKFGKVLITDAQAMGVFTTKLTEFFGELNETTHASDALTKSILFLGDHIPAIVAVVGTLSVALGVDLALKAIPSVIAGFAALDVAMLASIGPLAAIGGAAVAVGVKVGELADDIKQAYDDVGGLKQLTPFGQEGANIELLKKKIKSLQETIAHNPDNEVARRNLQGYQEDLEKLSETHKKVAADAKASGRAQVDASAAVVEDLERQLKLMQLTSREREIATKAYELEKAAQAATGASFTDTQRNEVKARLEKLRTLGEEEKLLEELHGPQDEYARRVAQATDLLQKQTITQQEFNKLLSSKEAAGPPPPPGGIPDPNARFKIDTGASGYLRALERETELLGLTNEQRTLRIELEKAAQSAGRQLNDDEVAYLTQQIQLHQDLNEQAAIRNAKIDEAGPLQKEILDELRGPEEHLVGLQTQLNVLYHDGAISAEEYQRALQKLNITAHQTDTSLEGGVSTGLSKIQLQLDDLATTGDQTITNAFNNANDALVNFATTGKISFSSLIDGIVSDLARLLLQQGEQGLFGNLFGNLAGTGGKKGTEGLLGDLFGGGEGAASGGIGDFFSSIGSFFGGFFAEGGDPPVGKPIVVGERGPELLKLKHPGSIVPANQTKELLQGAGRGGGAPTVNVAPPKVDVHVTNQLDSGSIVQTGLRTRAAEQEIMNIIARNRSAIRGSL